MIYAFLERRVQEAGSLDFLNRCEEKAASAMGISPVGVKKEEKKPIWEMGYVSLSHTEEYIVSVFSDSPVGVDMEICKRRNFAALSRRFCGRMLDESAFYRRWTAAESRFKEDGTPVIESLKTECEKRGRFFTFDNHLICFSGQGDVAFLSDKKADPLKITIG